MPTKSSSTATASARRCRSWSSTARCNSIRSSARRGKPLHIVSSGSSLLKVALHPAAGWLREAVGRVANAPAVYWVEYQALVDVINVYKVDPVVALGHAGDRQADRENHPHPA